MVLKSSKKVMKTMRFTVPLYGCKVLLLYAQDCGDADAVAGVCRRFGMDDRNELDTIRESVETGRCDGGATYHGFWGTNILVVVYEQSDRKEMCNTLFHEKRHVEDNMMKMFGLEGKEAAAYIAGYLGERFTEFMSRCGF